MGEPWEFDDDNPISPAPERREAFAWFRDFNFDTQFAIIGLAFVLTMLAFGTVFILVWDDGWSAWLSDRTRPLWEWRDPVLAVIAVVLPIVSAVVFVRGIVRGDLHEAWRTWGSWFGVAVGVLTLFVGWISAVSSWGWLVGIAFGWFPALIIAIMAGVLAWAIAPAVALLAFGGAVLVFVF